MKKLILFFFVLLYFVFTAFPVLADCAYDLPHQVPGTHNYLYADDNGSPWGSEFTDGPYNLAGYCCSKRHKKLVSDDWRYYHYYCSCSSFSPPPDFPYNVDPNDPDNIYGGGSGSDPENGAPPDDCPTEITRECFDGNGNLVYFEAIDCNGTTHAWGNFDLVVGQCLYYELGSRPPYDPDDIIDPDTGWEMPQAPVEPSPWYPATPEGDRPWQTPSPDKDLDGDGIPDDTDGDLDGDGIPNHEDLDNDNDGILDNNDLAPYSADNPRWKTDREYFNNGPGPGVPPDGGVIKTDDGEYIEWGDTSGDEVNWIDIGSPSPWNSPESFDRDLSGGGGGGGGGGGSASPPPPVQAPDPGPSADPDSIPLGSDNDGNTDDLAFLSDIVSNTQDNLEGQKIIADLLVGIEEKTGVYGAANNQELQRIGDILESIKETGVTNKQDSLSDKEISNLEGFFRVTHVYKDNNAEKIGWMLEVKVKNGDGTYTYQDYLIGQRSENYNFYPNSTWKNLSTLWTSYQPWGIGSSSSGFWVDGTGTGMGTGSGSGLTGDDVAGALAGDRAAGDAAAETGRLSQEAILDATGEPDYAPYQESDVPDYSQDQADYETEIDNLSNNSSISAIRDSLGITTSGSTPSLSCQLFGHTITFDFTPHASILQTIGNMWVSLCYLSGFFILMRS